MARFRKKKVTESLLDLLEIAIIGAVVFILVYIFVGQLLEVSGDSMYPTLINEERIIAEKISLAFKPLERDEIIIFRHPEEQDRLLIKRVVGLPGEKILISDGAVYINGKQLFEDYVNPASKTSTGKAIPEGVEFTIPEYTYFLLGDNRDESSDSRSFGAIRSELILGRALAVYSPLSDFRLIEH